MRGIVEISRASDWWEYKVPVFLGVAYITALIVNYPFGELWPLLPVIVLAVISSATYVSVLNDITDEKDDILAGKKNRMAGRSVGFKCMAIGCCVLLGVVSAWLLRPGWLTLLLFILNWVAYTAYSAPPIRLKKRGLLGVLADAGGGQMLPTLWVASSVLDHAINDQGTVMYSVLLPLGIWAGALGVRGILTHQAIDLDNDRMANVRTLAVRIGKRMVRKLVNIVILPIEVISLIYLLVMVNSLFVWVFLGLYLIFAWQMYAWLQIRLVAVLPAKSFRFFLFKYYISFLPLSLILAMAIKAPIALLLIPAHLVAFPDSWKRFTHHLQAILERRREVKRLSRTV